MPPIKAILSVVLCISVSPAAAQAQASNAVPSYECMGLKNLWNGEGPMPAPVPEYAAPGPGAASIGIAIATLIVENPPTVVGDRVRVVRPNGELAWIDRSQVTKWHVVSNPNAKCFVVRLPNGALRTTSH